MTRHIFAFLALLTGLAALGSPAEAALTQALNCDSSIAASSGDDAARPAASHAETPILAARSAPTAMPVCCTPAAPAALRLPVLMGIERAFE
ncbi:MAG: hypothetical protein ACXIT4_06690 [Erythrobacter sp.]